MSNSPYRNSGHRVSLPEIRSVTLKQQVYDSLKAAILGSNLERERVYSVNQIAKIFNVSRTPVAMAIERLSQEQLVTVLPNYGFRITQFSRQQVTDIFALREAIEVHVVAHLAGTEPDVEAACNNLRAQRKALQTGLEPQIMRTDMDFHSALAEATGNRWLSGALTRIRDLITLANLNLQNNRQWNRQVVSEHSAIMDAIMAGDPLTAQDMMTSHVRQGALVLIRSIENAEILTGKGEVKN